MIDIYARSIRRAAGLGNTSRKIAMRDVPRTQRRVKWLSPRRRHMKDPYDL